MPGKQPFRLPLRFIDPASGNKPAPAVGDKVSCKDHQDRRNDPGGVHPAPCPDIGIFVQNKVPYGRSHQGPHRLEPEGAQNQFPPCGAGNTLRDHHMGRGIVTAKGRSHEKEKKQKPRIVGTDNQQEQTDCKEDHLDDKHPLPADTVGEPSQSGGTDEDSEKRCRPHGPLLHSTQTKLLYNQWEGHPGHKNDQPFKKLARRGQYPDPPLHGGHGCGRNGRSVRPDRGLVDILLDGFYPAPVLIIAAGRCAGP